MRPRVLLTDAPWTEFDIERSVLAEARAELFVSPDGDESTLASLAVDADAILTAWAKVTDRVIESSPRLRVVARMGIGLDNIDVACATRRGIPVTNVPDYCLQEVAEHTLALLLALARRVAQFHVRTKAGEYTLSDGPSLRRIAGQTLGLVGFGATGRVVAEKAAALGLRVVATTKRRRALAPGVEWVDFESLLRTSDYVSLHAPSTPETRNLIDRSALRLMRPSAYLINTSRGALVDEAALGEALAAGRLAGAALDVQAVEPPDLTQPLYRDPRVIVTPHAAFISAESLLELRTRAAGQVVDVLLGRPAPNVVNAEALQRK